MAFFPPITNRSRIKKSQFVAPSLDGERSQLFLTPCILHFRLKLFKGMVAESWSRHDNCTSQKSRVATTWLDEYFSDFSAINYPPRSPDLNPIDHLRDVLKQGVKGHQTAPTSLTELWTTSANIWQVVPVERFQKLIEPKPRRVAAVIKAKGDSTRYIY
ncbi:transposable element Tcb2 transposase [Trichonephila clavipes]|uniref:Transposable element Tcb2 transposase n=1 Tax=Trichonephila clavipes TaxID=2585209 RepID=A0A8X6V4S9_TRICX|nr:transposable element Tcb2 transposase [Trichonephila clavipes]